MQKDNLTCLKDNEKAGTKYKCMNEIGLVHLLEVDKNNYLLIIRSSSSRNPSAVNKDAPDTGNFGPNLQLFHAALFYQQRTYKDFKFY